MIHNDNSTGKLISNLDLNALDGCPAPKSELLDSLAGFILSASGWRKVFAADGSEESRGPSVSPADRTLTAMAAAAYLRFTATEDSGRKPTVVVGTDTRPTGPTLADVIVRTLVSAGARTRYLQVSAAPEIMAYAASAGDVDGFIYLSASHNPVGHNGLKFGLSDGGVIGGEAAARLISLFTAMVEGYDVAPVIAARDLDAKALTDVYGGIRVFKSDALAAYRRLVFATAVGRTDDSVAAGRTIDDEPVLDEIRRGAALRRIGVVADHNGSARAATIDAEVLGSLGVAYHAVHAVPGDIAHRIVPEGESLEPCCRELERMNAGDSAFVLGYMPDNDGDRGNLVVYDEQEREARPLAAQQVFALACVSELAFDQYTRIRLPGPQRGAPQRAIAVNGPTSMRVEEIARAFGAEVHRAEVGEASVVRLAGELRERGYEVRILGEGSNGGNITHPARVRDPLNTLMSVVKLLTLRSGPAGPGLFEIWCSASGKRAAYREDFTLSDVLRSLPVYTTTSAYEPRAIMRIGTTDHGKLKTTYESAFPPAWEQRRQELLERAGIVSWSAFNYEGTETRPGFGNRAPGGSGRGGFRIVFCDGTGEPVAFIWMRGSGTEPVFRVLADVRGDRPELETYLLEWHKALITEADVKG